MTPKETRERLKAERTRLAACGIEALSVRWDDLDALLADADRCETLERERSHMIFLVEATRDALDGKPISDFAESFEVPRQARDVAEALTTVRIELHASEQEIRDTEFNDAILQHTRGSARGELQGIADVLAFDPATMPEAARNEAIKIARESAERLLMAATVLAKEKRVERQSLTASRAETAALRNFYNVVRELHYGRMPEAVQIAADAVAALTNQETP